MQEAPKYVTSVLSETDGQVAEKAQGGAAEHRETLTEVNEKKTEAEDQEDYLSELESLFEVGNGPTWARSEPTANLPVSDPGTGVSAWMDSGSSQAVPTMSFDVTKGVNGVTWCDTATWWRNEQNELR